MVNLKDLAAKSGFSVAVVSRALNPRPDRHARVAPATRRRLLRLAREMGFRRNRMAEFTRRGGSPTVCVFLPKRANRLVADLIFGIAESLAESDLPLQIDCDNYLEGFRRFIRRTTDMAHSGIISYAALMAIPDVEREVARYRARGGQIVLLNTPARVPQVPVVSIDNVLGGRLAAERLLARGCRRLAVLGAFEGRNEGFRETLSAAGLTAREIAEPAIESEPMRRFCRGASRRAPTGLFAVTDRLALHAMRALADTGLRIGRDVMLIGYDDLDLTPDMTPPLTTLHQPFFEEGRLAAQKLARMINGAREPSVCLPPQLIIRESA